MSKVALLIGINYRGTAHELNGCINDVENAKEYLLTKGYSSDNIITLTDDTDLKPTRKNIMSMLLEVTFATHGMETKATGKMNAYVRLMDLSL